MQDYPPAGRSYERPWTFEDQRRLMLATRSFTGQAVIALVLYFLLWIPGLVANIVWLREARGIEREVGVRPPGTSLLAGLLWFFLGVPLLLACAIVAFAVLQLFGGSMHAALELFSDPVDVRFTKVPAPIYVWPAKILVPVFVAIAVRWAVRSRRDPAI